MKAFQLMKKENLFVLILLIAVPVVGFSATRDVQNSSRKSRGQLASCPTCRSKKVVKSSSCHPANYLNPKIRKNYNTAIRDLHRNGIKPKVTSLWRSTSKQAYFYRCSRSAACRTRNPGLYYAKAPGTSAHEAGFAVDISGVAAGRRGAKRLTPRGRKIVRVMEKNGFSWRYGLKDPAHFEADPRRHGYKNLRQAIKYTQTNCSVKISKRKRR